MFYCSFIVYLFFSFNLKVLGLKLLHPVIFWFTPFSLVFVFISLSIITEDYHVSLIDLIYNIWGFQSRTLTYNSIITFIEINFALVGFLLSLKAFIAATVIVGNIIYIYLFSFVVILISLLLHLTLSGLSLMSYLLYLFLTKVELYLFILFLLESFSHLFQSLTLANRLSINLIAGSLLLCLLFASFFLLILTGHIYYSLVIFILWTDP